MSLAMESFVVPDPILTLESAIALGLDEDSALLAVRLQQQDLREEDADNFRQHRSIPTLPSCVSNRKDSGRHDSGADKDRTQTCIVCLVEEVRSRLGCGHAALCSVCTQSMLNLDTEFKCPLCRTPTKVVDSGMHVSLQSSYVEPSRLTDCDGCQTPQFFGQRFVCQTCAKVQLCSQCHEDVTMRASFGGRENSHNFYVTPLPYSDPKSIFRLPAAISGNPFYREALMNLPATLSSQVLARLHELLINFSNSQSIHSVSIDGSEGSDERRSLSEEATVFLCDYCYRDFNSDDYSSPAAAERARNQHQRDAHEMPRGVSFACQYCSRRFHANNYTDAATARRACQQHEEAAHNQVFECAHCGLAFGEREHGGADAARQAWAAHERSSRCRPLECPHCDRLFWPREYARPDGAERARRQHEQAAHPRAYFECGVCTRRFYEAEYASPDLARRACAQHSRNAHPYGS